MKTRVISAIIAIILVVPFIYYGGIPYALVVSFLALYSYKEILDNVMYYGLSFQQKHCLFSKNNKKKCSKKEKDHYNYLSKGEKRS